MLTLRETWSQETRDLLDEGIGSDESIVLACELLDQFLVLVELLEIVGRHSVDTTVLSTIDIVLVTENASSARWLACGAHMRSKWAALPDGHVGARNLGELDGTRETLITLRVVVLQADLELDGLEEVALLLLIGVLEQLLHVGTHTSDRDLRHDRYGLPIVLCGGLLVRLGVFRGRWIGDQKFLNFDVGDEFQWRKAYVTHAPLLKPYGNLYVPSLGAFHRPLLPTKRV